MFCIFQCVGAIKMLIVPMKRQAVYKCICDCFSALRDIRRCYFRLVIRMCDGYNFGDLLEKEKKKKTMMCHSSAN